MTFDAFKASLTGDTPPDGLNRVLAALWHAGRDEWDAAHKLAQAEKNEAGWWVHAHLHRVEGDLSNADYWYKRAGKKRPGETFEEEWESITAFLLTQ